jgi:hypothetical protein
VHTKIIRKNKKPTNESAGTDKKRTRIEAKAFMTHSELVLDDDSSTPYRLIQNEPTPAPTKPTFSTKDQDNANKLTKITEDLVALHIGHNPNLTSATMLVNSGASHILVRQEHIRVLKDVVMSAPNTKSFASLKSAKKGSELSAIGRGLLQIGPFSLQAFIFSDDELDDTLLGLDPLTEHGCTAIFTQWIEKSNQKAWKVQIQQQTEAPDIAPIPVASSAFAGKLQGTRQTDNEYVQFDHASLGFPTPTTFMNAVRKRFITGPNQYTRLTPKLVTKNMPNSMATARGHLDRTRMGKPHADSQSVSALRRFHDSQIINDLKRSRLRTPEPFSANNAPRSRTLHMDYTGPLPTPCTFGVQYFQIAC